MHDFPDFSDEVVDGSATALAKSRLRLSSSP